MEIKRITKLDIEQVYSISSVELKDESWTKQQLFDIVDDKNYYFLGVFVGDNLVSFCICVQSVDDINITSIATNNEYKNKGLATTLINSFKELARGTKRSLSLEVNANNVPAIKLYQKCDFKAVNVRKGYYKDKSDAIIMFWK